MSLSKKLRFEVFKRDGFRCGYCGRTPPTVILQADHIDPKSNGGSDDINNLITACHDCNAGKTNIPLSEIPNSVKGNLVLLQEKETQIRAYNDFVYQVREREDNEIEHINYEFRKVFPKQKLSDTFKNATVRRFIKMLPFYDVKDAMTLACVRKATVGPETVIKYFCGICWKKIKGE